MSSEDYTPKKIANAIQRLEKSDLSEQNIKDLKELRRSYELEEKSGHTVASLFSCFLRMSGLIDFDLRNADKEQLKDLVLKINRNNHEDYSGYSAHTRADDRQALQAFYSWLEGEEGPEICDFFRCKVRPNEEVKIDPEELIGVEEAEKMIDACMNARDRCMLGILWDSGMRTKEIMALEWRDIIVEEDGMMKVHVRNGKNGPRKIYLYECVPLVSKWLDEYPSPEPEDPLWIDLRYPEKKKGIGKRALAKQVAEARKRIQIPQRKKTNPHAWRKARATEMAARGMNIPAANKFFGWARGSDVFKRYIWLAETDLENTIREMYGLRRRQKEQKFIGENLPEYEESNHGKTAVAV